MTSIEKTFIASLRSVGTACTMAMIGVYLHRRKFVSGENKKALALISQQVTIPAFLFSKILWCSQDLSDDPCPSVMDSLSSGWLLLFWPAYVVGCGLLVGYAAAKLTHTPDRQLRSVLVACSLGNSTGLPITLLTVVHDNFPQTTKLGSVDPTLFLSVYLLLYPVLQWGIGGWLLTSSIQQHEYSTISKDNETNKENLEEVEGTDSLSQVDSDTEVNSDDLNEINANDESETVNKMCGTLSKIASRCLQPPVIAAMLGLFIASIGPLRNIFVDTFDRDDDALLEWAFDAIYTVGQAAVPLNMIILGCNLSASHLKQNPKTNAGDDDCAEEVVGENGDDLFSTKTTAAIITGKMIVMPIIGILSVLTLNASFLNIPQDIDAPFYLVAMIVFITPTANNVMVMVELSGSGTNGSIAQVIGWQYALAPALLSLSMTAVVTVAMYLDR
mmetsp:Transcript_16391/g.29823  ORF Transcript_16391/g.29823 Transcript_16391/m.29823 type:complete len:444 (-) Transcript_16391:67-1398(-)|eukprot:CAMPEP_0198295998 /NCGR_PEP_ID=MMETSP1449-20131203/30443_1 /TAXON_ID=420275 /ORGANISM="Attheya septentrionalis, Strain CCMP2084" /LENGTH=443 /DNA_ID=CAMNT_0043996459 /DNA_START=178 /DNA_END=1509 /DNA_ORIENTATION=+